jgi:hypothetical protein
MNYAAVQSNEYEIALKLITQTRFFLWRLQQRHYLFDYTLMQSL